MSARISNYYRVPATACRFRLRPLALAVAIASCFALDARANPTGPTVVNGQVSILRNANLLQITNSPSSILNWQSFSIGANEITRFVQQSASSTVLNRVTGQNPSTILGALQSNGRVFLLNPSGIVFGAGAQIDVGGLVASSLNLSNADFLAGRLNFTQTLGAGSIVNQGTINTAQGGNVYLVGPAVTNSGIITSPKGEVILAAGNSVELVNPGTPNLRVEITAPDNQATNLGQIVADSGRIGIYAGLINHSGTIRADTAQVTDDGRIVLKATKIANLEFGSVTSASGANGGSVEIKADVLIHTGSVQADGAQGGSIAVQARNVLSAGRISADGSPGVGGEINVQASGRILQTSAAHVSADGAAGGGKVTLQAADRVFGSGTLTATGQGAGSTGGEIRVLGNEIVLLGTSLDASGDARGGTVLAGGDFQGKNPAVQNATTNWINFSTTLNADARITGDGGKVIVWSDRETQFYGTIGARGGATSGDGGFIEVSGKENLVFGGMANAGAPNGTPGSLLLDPKFILIDSGGGGIGSFLLVDPNPGAGDQFGTRVVVLPNNNVVVTDPSDDLVASNAGAVYLFNGTTGALLSTLTGGSVDDQVGSGGGQTPGITALVNGNFVVASPTWSNGAAAAAGAVTFGNGTTGVSGAVSATNSLVGATTGDIVGWGGDTKGVIALTNGNYVVSEIFWQNSGATRSGAVTWVDGTNGNIAGSASRGGIVSAANSLVGTAAFDGVGNSVIALTNGNYATSTPFWGSNRGAATWVDGATGNIAGSASPGGAVSAANSLVGNNGSPAGDQIGHGVFALANGNYVVESGLWRSGGVQLGAVTWVDGSNGHFAGSASPGGFISSSNSLVGSQSGDLVGLTGVVPLSNSNYVVRSANWQSSANILAGAVTLVDGSNGNIVATGAPGGAVSAANSLVGSGARDKVGSGGVVELANGNYVVVSPEWNKGGSAFNPGMGAVTFGNQASGVVGVVSSANSLVGSVVTDAVGLFGVTPLTNGNYVVNSPTWTGTAANVGAVTWGSGTTGVSGAVSSSNSLVGTTAGDFVGTGGVRALSNGNYVVGSPSWTGTAADVGAATWGNGLGGTVGAVTALNSLVGSTASDQVGSNGVTALTNGNYVVISPSWNNGAATSAGAVTWGNGLGGTVGTVTSLNSLVGSTINDQVGVNGVTALANGNYVVISPYWNNGAATEAGAVTFGNGATGVSGVVSAANSLVGSTAADHVGLNGVTTLTNGNYVVSSNSWNNGAATEVGAVTFGSGTSGVSGAVSAANSLVGTTTSDQIGSGGVFALSNGDVVVSSPSADNGAIVDAGLVHVISPSAGGGAPFTNPSIFSDDPSGTITITPAGITAITNTGTAVILQANTDLTLAAGSNIISNNPVGAGGAITMQAGRSILLNSSITTDNGNLTITANDPGAQAANRDAGAGGITMATGTTLDAGAGGIALTVGTGVPGAASGNLVAANVIAEGGISLTVNGGGNLSLNGQVGNGVGNVTLVSTGTVTQSAPIRATGLELLGVGGTFDLDTQNNAVTTLAGISGNVSFGSGGNFEVGMVNATSGLTTTGFTSLGTSGTVTQSKPITAPQLFVGGSGGTFNLDTQNNVVTTLAGTSFPNPTTVRFRSDAGFDIGQVDTHPGFFNMGNITLVSTGTVTQSQPIGATGLELLGVGGTFNLDTQNNAVTTLAGISGNVSFGSGGNFEVGMVNATSGLTTTGFTSLGTSGTVTQSKPITAPQLFVGGSGGTFNLDTQNNVVTTLAGTSFPNPTTVRFRSDAGFDIGQVDTHPGFFNMGNVTLVSTGTVTQSQPIRATGLGLLGTGGTFNLTLASNAVTTLAGNTGTVQFYGDAGFGVGTVGSTAGLTTTGNTTFNSTGTVTQSAPIRATGLELLGVGGTFDLDTQNNAVTTLAGISGNVSFGSGGNFEVGMVNATSGLTTTGFTSLGTSGTVTQSKPITAPQLFVGGSGGTFNLDTQNNVVTTLAGTSFPNPTTVRFRSDAGFDIGQVDTHPGFFNMGNITLVSTGTVTQSQPIGATGLELLGVGGTFNLDTQNNAVTTLAGISGNVSFGSGGNFEVGMVNATSGLTTTGFTSLGTSGTVTQSKPITAPQLFVGGSGGTFNLDTQNNVVTTLAGTSFPNPTTVRFRSDAGFDIGQVDTHPGFFNMGNVTLVSTGTVTQSQPIRATGLGLLGTGGTFNLTLASNAVTTLAGNTGTVQFYGDAGFGVGTVGSTAGLTTTGNTTFNSTGTVTQSAPIRATGLELLGVGGTFDLDTQNNAVTTLAGISGNVSFGSGGNFEVGMVNATSGLTTTGFTSLGTSGTVTQSKPITAPQLFVGGSGGTFNLDTQNNVVTTLAGTSFPNPTTVRFRSDAGFDIGQVDTHPGFFNMGNITLVSTGTVTQSQPIGATGLELLGVGGTFDLNTQNNAVTTLAANTGSVNFTDNAALTVGTVNSTAGLTTTGSTTLTTTGASTNDIAVLPAVGNVTAVTTLTAAGSIKGFGQVSGSSVNLEAAGSIESNTFTTGTLALKTHGVGSVGNINVQEQNILDTNRVVLSTDASAQTVTLRAPSITVNGDVGNTTDSLSLIAFAGNLFGGVGTARADFLTLTATGGIGIATPVKTNTTLRLNLLSSGAGSAGNINVTEPNALNTNRVALSTNASSVQAVTLSAPSITVAGLSGSAFAIGNATDDLFLIATAGDIVGGTGAATARNLTLDAARDIGNFGAAVNTNTTGTLSLTARGGASTWVNEANTLNTSRLVLSPSSRVVISAPAITVDANIGTAGNDLTLTATAGDILGGVGTVSARSLELKATGIVGTGTPVRTNTSGGLLLTSEGVFLDGIVRRVGSSLVNVEEANSLNTDRVLVGVNFSQSDVILSAPSITVGGDIGNANSGTLRSLTLAALSGDIVGGPGTVRARSLTLSAAGGIGIGTTLNTSTVKTNENGINGALILATQGVGGAGNINVNEANALDTTLLTLSTHSSPQVVTLGAPSITYTTNIGSAADDLVFAGPSMTSGGAPSGIGRLTNLAGSSLIFASTSPLTVSRPIVNAGSASISAGSTLVIGSGGSFQNAATGTLSGAGTIDMRSSGGPLRTDGSIAPGAPGSAGTLAIQGDVTIGATGSLNTERFSNTSYDKLAVSGQAILAGSFGMTNAAPSLLSDGSTYTVLTYGSRSGAFATISLPALCTATYLTDRFNIAAPIGSALDNPAVMGALNHALGSMPSFNQFANLFGSNSTGAIGTTNTTGATGTPGITGFTGAAGTTGATPTKLLGSCSSSKSLKLAGACTL